MEITPNDIRKVVISLHLIVFGRPTSIAKGPKKRWDEVAKVDG